MHDALDLTHVLEINEHQREREEGQTGPDDVRQKVGVPGKIIESSAGQEKTKTKNKS